MNDVTNIKTDLAAEIKEFRNLTEKDGFYDETSEKDGIKIREVRILTEDASKKIGKPVGTYITVDFADAFEDDEVFNSAAEAISEKIKSMVGENVSENVLVVGLGNAKLTSDAIGPETLSGILVTRHLKNHMPEVYGSLPLRELSALTPGVLGTTGIESADIVKAVAEKTKPSLIVAIDALASRRAERVCTTVQMSFWYSYWSSPCAFML
ncbi:MAG: GPR endopeptidase [Clostridia bacterium]|nr:GPR endopeptidase [Clostridia bacterium]